MGGIKILMIAALVLAGMAGKYKISADVVYRFEGDNSSTVPTNYLLTAIIEP